MRGRRQWIVLLAGLLLGLAGAGGGARASSSIPSVPRYGVLEQSLGARVAAEASPDRVSVDVHLLSPTRKAYAVGGFYEGRSNWKFRFAPSELGRWHWRARVRGGTLRGPSSGAFDVVRSASPGFVRISPYNPLRWTFANGTPYYPIGLNECTNVQNRRAELWGLDGGFRVGPEHSPGRLVDIDTYMRAYSSAGFNLFRWGPDNCSFALYERIDPAGNVYSESGMAAADRLFKTLRRYGFRIEMVLFGSSPPFGSESDPAKLAAVDRYVKYVVDRYGAYVDFWELTNEASPSDAWVTQVAGYLRQVDPYRHPVGTSWGRPQLPVIQFGTDHWYQTEDASRSDAVAWSRLRRESALSYRKPTLVDEQGNTGLNWDATSALRLRLRSWTAFFAETGLVFWNASFIKNCCPNGTSSVYIGPQERGYVRALQRYTSGFDPRAIVEAAKVAPSGAARAYALRGPRAYGLYLVAAGARTAPLSGVTVTVRPERAGTATWIDPATGRVLRQAKVRAGTQRLAVPPFTTDIALKVQ